MKSKLNKAVVLSVVVIGAIVSLGAAVNVGKPSKIITLNATNTVSLSLPITGGTASLIQQELMKLDNIKTKDPIYLVLNSPGGSIEDGLKIVATAQGLRRQVHTISLFSASMSFVVSQLLNTRYVTINSTLMSHPASVEGMGGTIPGNLVTRVNALLASLDAISTLVAIRAGMDPVEYNGLIERELWMQGSEALRLKFADAMVAVRCDETLEGPGEPKKLAVGPFNVSVIFHKCPLITEPLEAKLDGHHVTAQELRKSLKIVGGSHYEIKQ